MTGPNAVDDEQAPRRVRVRFSRRPEPPDRPLRSVSGATVWSPRRRRLTAGLLLTVATGAFESLGVGTVMPAANAELHDLRHYGLVFSAFMLAQLLGIVGGGMYADRRSPERPYVIGTVIFAAGLLITGTAQSMLVMAGGRALQGLGAGAVSGLAVYAVRRCYEESARPQMLALQSTAFVVPGLLGPSLAAVINDLVGWRWVFLGIVPLMPLAALLVIPVLRLTAIDDGGGETTPSSQSARTIWALAGGVGLGLVALALETGVVRIAAGVVAVALGAYSIGRIFPRGTIRFRAGQPAALAFILWGAMAYYSIEAFLPLSLTSIHETSIIGAGLTLSAGTALWTVGTWLQARLVTRLGGPRLLFVGAPVLLLGVALTAALMTTAWVPIPFVSLSWAVVALGMGLTSSTATLVILELARDGAEGQVASSIQLATLLGGAVGTALAGLRVATDADALASSIRIIGLFATVCAVLAVFAAFRARSSNG